MAHATDDLKETASQTAGPYVHIGLSPAAAGFEAYERPLGHDIIGPNAIGERIEVEGQIVDGTGSLVKDALIEVWQANANGVYAHPEGGGAVEDGFRGWGRAMPDFDTGLWRLHTIKPGPTRGRNGATQAPHINLWIVARGINIGLNTRIYFEDETEANASDPVLSLIEWEARRKTLLAKRQTVQDKVVYRFDIHLQGAQETVFFDI